MLLGKRAEDSVMLTLLRQLAEYYREDLSLTTAALTAAREDVERLETKKAEVERQLTLVERDITKIEGEMRN